MQVVAVRLAKAVRAAQSRVLPAKAQRTRRVARTEGTRGNLERVVRERARRERPARVAMGEAAPPEAPVQRTVARLVFRKLRAVQAVLAVTEASRERAPYRARTLVAAAARRAARPESRVAPAATQPARLAIQAAPLAMRAARLAMQAARLAMQAARLEAWAGLAVTIAVLAVREARARAATTRS
jgi:hypothetical protein